MHLASSQKSFFSHVKLVHFGSGSCRDARPPGPWYITSHSYSILWFHISCKRSPCWFVRGFVPRRLWPGGHQWTNWAQEEAVKHLIKHSRQSDWKNIVLSRTRTKSLHGYQTVERVNTPEYHRKVLPCVLCFFYFFSCIYCSCGRRTNGCCGGRQKMSVDRALMVVTVFSDDFWWRESRGFWQAWRMLLSKFPLPCLRRFYSRMPKNIKSRLKCFYCFFDLQSNWDCGLIPCHPKVMVAVTLVREISRLLILAACGPPTSNKGQQVRGEQRGSGPQT